MMPFDYYMFMAETENQFPDQRKKSIEAAIRDLRSDKHNYMSIAEILALHNLRESTMTSAEINYINRRINS